MHVLIIGAGIAGLTLAAELDRRGHEPLVVERSPTLRDAGYMIDFFGPGFDAAERMGLLPRLAEIHYPIARLAFLDARGNERFALPYPTMRHRLFRDRHFNFMRGELERVLFERVGDAVELRFGTTITALDTTSEPARASLDDGSSWEGDLVVGADGVHSATRRLLFGDIPPRYLGYDTSAFIVHDDALRRRITDEFAMLTAADRQVAAYPIRGGAVATFLIERREVPLRARDPAIIRQHLMRTFGNLPWIVRELLESCDAGCEPFYDEVSQVVLSTWSRGRATLVGDACYAVSLLAGQGASLAMAGAWVLADELSRTTDVSRALERYERRMQPLTRAKQEEGRRMARWFVPQGQWRRIIRDATLRLSLLPGLSALARRSVLGQAHLPPPSA
jgi:2-polyprenyl-6-methoxyphenol hydroxylase-like FAD-dependent oxidoreductase